MSLRSPAATIGLRSWVCSSKTGRWSTATSSEGPLCFFVDDGSGVFDQLDFGRPDEAVAALVRNGFSRFRESPDLQEFLEPPPPPFTASAHPNGKIYSSGRFWR